VRLVVGFWGGGLLVGGSVPRTFALQLRFRCHGCHVCGVAGGVAVDIGGGIGIGSPYAVRGCSRSGRVHSFEPWLLTVAALSAIPLVRCRMYSSLRPLARLSTSTAQQLESTSTSNSTTPRRRATHTTRHARTNKRTTRIRNLYRSTTTAAAAGKTRRKGQGWQ